MLLVITVGVRLSVVGEALLERGGGPTGIERLDVEGPADAVAAWCGGHPPALHCLPGRSGPRAVTVGFADGGTAVFGG